ncbi:YtzH-like family protein [Paraliobacillus sp. JSM ZJ581]|uniref:YtzH-like family protein n=1 Tax=Paraliobacillus sp. JSM ZJ581 TaxID=3342118 RepID=UPI0035A988B4
MTLNAYNQLNLLSDLLSEQAEDCCGSISEYQQIKRLVQSLMANEAVDDEYLMQVLPEIYNYGRQGEIAQNLEQHISTNQENINTWLQHIPTSYN